jgi:DNA-binding beta-propeller fold protein YncE
MRFFVCAAAVGCALALPAMADTPINGIGSISVSPDGRSVLAAAENRVVYALDPADLSVRERIWIGVSPVWIQHVADGSHVLVRETQGDLIAYEADGFREAWRVSRTEDADYADGVDQVVFAVRQNRETIVGVMNATTTDTVATFNLGEFRVQEIAISDDGKRITVLNSGDKRESEERKNPPSEMRGVERELFSQLNDERGSIIVQIDVASGEMTSVETWYTGKNTKGMAFSGEDTIVLAYGSNMARISPAGEVELIDTGASFHYGAMLSDDGTQIISGSLAQFNIKTLGQTGSREINLPERLPGWPEYLMSFAQMPDGRLLAGTSAFRIIEISADRNSVKGVPVH